MKKLVIALFLIAVMLTSACAINLSHASTTPTVTVDSATQQFPSGHVGSTIQVNITISNVQDLWLWDLEMITFNPAMLNLTNVSEGPFLEQAGQTMFITEFTAYQAAQGYVPDTTDTLLEATGASGSGVLVTLTFTVLQLGTSQIAINQTNLIAESNMNNAADTMPVNTINADITVGSSASSTSSPTASPTPSDASSSNPQTTPNSPASTNTPDPSATGNTSNIPEFPIFPLLLGLLIAATITILVAAKKKVK